MRRPALWSLACFATGIVLGDSLDLPSVLVLGILLFTLVLSLISFYKKHYNSAGGLLLATLLLAGFWRYELKTRDFPLNHISYFTDLNFQVNIEGKIVNDPDIREDKTFLYLETKRIWLNEKGYFTRGKILVKIRENTNQFSYADKVFLEGFLFSPSLQRNPGAFDYKKYLSAKEIYGQVNLRSAKDLIVIERKASSNIFLNHLIFPLKRKIENIFQTTLSQTNAALLSGFLLGERRGIEKDIYKMFTDTGTVHLLAVSGSNVGLLLLFSWLLFKLLNLPRITRIILSFGVILGFAYLTDNQPSVVRASIMAAVFISALLFERSADLINVISFAALIILGFLPQAFFDVSFQLSFAAVFGIAVLVTQIEKKWKSGKRFLQNWIIRPFSVSSAALISTFPLTVYYFNNFATIGFFFFLVIVPQVSLTILLGTITVLSGLIYLPLAELVSFFNNFVLQSIFQTVKFFSQLPYAHLKLTSFSLTFIIFFYVLVIFLAFALTSRKALKIFSLILLLGLNLAVWQRVWSKEGFLKITFLDMRERRSCFIEFPNGNTGLVGISGLKKEFDYAENVIAPFLYHSGKNKIDYILVFQDGIENEKSLRFLTNNFKVANLLATEAFYKEKRLFLKELTILNPSLKVSVLQKENYFDKFGVVKVLNKIPDKFSEENHSPEEIQVGISYGDFKLELLWSENLILKQFELPEFLRTNLALLYMKQKLVGVVKTDYSFKHKYWNKRVPNFYWTKLDGAIRLETDGNNLEIKPCIPKSDEFYR